MIERPLTLVDTFVPQGSEADKLLAYPFAKPRGSHITDGEMVIGLPDDLDTFTVAANAYLVAQGLPLIGDRIPVIEFGSNSSPFQTRQKMAKYGGEELQVEMQTIPKLVGELPDTVIAWHGTPGQKGSTFAEAYKDEDTIGHNAACTIAFMDEKQLAVMHATEGVTYEVVQIGVLAGSERQLMRAYAYVANKSVVLLKDGKPVPVKRTGEPGSENAMTAEEAVDYMLEHGGEAIGIKIARELVKRTNRENLKGRKALQASVAKSLAEQGLSREFSYPKAEGDAVARADFNGFRAPHYQTLRLMEQIVQPLRPGPTQITALATNLEAEGIKAELALLKARAQLDVAHVLRGRAFEELKRRTGLTEITQKSVA